MKQDNKSFQNLIQKFFLEWLMKQRNVSPETIKSYRDTFRIFIKYLDGAYNIKPSAITIDCLRAEYILGFLQFLEQTRKNKPKTINTRLSGIKSFIQYLTFEIPEYSALLNRSLMIPFQKEDKREMDFISKDEYLALLDVCESDTELGCRDQLMLMLLYNTGVRVSELIELRVRDIVNDASGIPSYIHIHGKGRKERDVPLWKNTAVFLKKFMSQHNKSINDKIFVNRVNDELTRSGVRYRLNCLVEKASYIVPTLNQKNISPHSFRHTVALNLLQSGIDISTIAIWLGHESILTTHKYMTADMEMKRRTLEKLADPGVNSFNYQPDETIITFLTSL